MSELDKIILGGEVLDFIDRTARTIANSANESAQLAISTANSANTKIDTVVSGFETNFIQIPTSGSVLVSPYLCKRNNTITVEFPNISPNSEISNGSWNKAFTLPSGYRPLMNCYRTIHVGGTTTVLFEIRTSGGVYVYSPTITLTTNDKFYDGFTFLSEN